jgi:hypothetical protein
MKMVNDKTVKPDGRARCVFRLLSRFSTTWAYAESDQYAPTQESAERFRALVACPECKFFPRREHSESPVPFPLEMHGQHRGSEAAVHEGGFATVTHELREAIGDAWPKQTVFSEAIEVDPPPRERRKRWSIQLPRALQVYTFRNRGVGHRQCPGCGAIVCCNWSIKNAVARSQVRENQVMIDEFGGIFLTPALADRLRLTEKFPDLWYYRYRVVEKPLDGWTLPGDPGWDGVLRPPPGWGADGWPLDRPGGIPLKQRTDG